ncbi:MAG: HAMP domain-containing histidine kinase [Deltaproteobacteria bacterium]|nr:HAMP domain-containing histidine kinase [Deltaproteobacteria bacterium]
MSAPRANPGEAGPRAWARARAAGPRILPGVAAAALLGLAGWNLHRAQAWSDTLTMAEADRLGRALRPHLDPPPQGPAAESPAAQAAVDAAVAALQADGLLAVLVVDPTGAPALVAGAPVLPPHLLPATEDQPLRGAGGARALLPPPGGARGGPGPAGDHSDALHLDADEDEADWAAKSKGKGQGKGKGKGKAGGLGFIPRIYVDLSAPEADALVAGAQRQLALSALVGAGLVGLGLLLGRAEDARRTADQALLGAQHLASLGQVAGVMAHELRTPLAALKGHAQLLEELTEGRARDRAARVVTEAQRLERVTEDLLAFARMASISRSPQDPAALVQAVAARAPDRVRLVDAGAPRPFPLDPERFTQLVENLVNNALAIDEDGGEVWVRLEAAGGGLRLVVDDQGPGLPPGDPERLFEPFFTTRARGTGLGLAVARRCAVLHGGQLWAERRPEGGARFVAVLPPGPTSGLGLIPHIQTGS